MNEVLIHAIIWTNLPNYILCERSYNKRPNIVWFHFLWFHFISRIGKSTGTERRSVISLVAGSKEKLELEGYLKAGGGHKGQYPFSTSVCMPPGAGDSEGISFQFLLILPAQSGPCLSVAVSCSSVIEVSALLLPNHPTPLFTNISCALTCCLH